MFNDPFRTKGESIIGRNAVDVPIRRKHYSRNGRGWSSDGHKSVDDIDDENAVPMRHSLGGHHSVSGVHSG